MQSAARQLKKPPVQEVVAIYDSADELDIALTDLVDAGFRPTQMGLVARKSAVRDHLANACVEVGSKAYRPVSSQKLSFIRKRTAKSSVAAFLGGLGTVNSATSDTAIVASSAVLAGAVGSMTDEASIDQSSAVHADKFKEGTIGKLVEALEENSLLLFVRSYDMSKLVKAKEVLHFSDSIDSGIVSYKA